MAGARASSSAGRSVRQARVELPGRRAPAGRCRVMRPAADWLVPSSASKVFSSQLARVVGPGLQLEPELRAAAGALRSSARHARLSSVSVTAAGWSSPWVLAVASRSSAVSGASLCSADRSSARALACSSPSGQAAKGRSVALASSVCAGRGGAGCARRRACSRGAASGPSSCARRAPLARRGELLGQLRRCTSQGQAAGRGHLRAAGGAQAVPGQLQLVQPVCRAAVGAQAQACTQLAQRRVQAIDVQLVDAQRAPRPRRSAAPGCRAARSRRWARPTGAGRCAAHAVRRSRCAATAARLPNAGAAASSPDPASAAGRLRRAAASPRAAPRSRRTARRVTPLICSTGTRASSQAVPASVLSSHHELPSHQGQRGGHAEQVARQAEVQAAQRVRRASAPRMAGAGAVATVARRWRAWARPSTSFRTPRRH